MHCTSLDHSALHLQKGVLFLFSVHALNGSKQLLVSVTKGRSQDS